MVTEPVEPSMLDPPEMSTAPPAPIVAMPPWRRTFPPGAVREDAPPTTATSPLASLEPVVRPPLILTDPPAEVPRPVPASNAILPPVSVSASPARMDTLPPLAPVPADTDTSPPAPEPVLSPADSFRLEGSAPLPVAIEMPPAEEVAESPVRIVTAPDEYPSEDPVATSILPSAVAIVVLPAEETDKSPLPPGASPLPVAIETDPPTPPEPAVKSMLAPTPSIASLDPPDRLISPALPFDVLPVEISMAPLPAKLEPVSVETTIEPDEPVMLEPASS